MRIKLLMLLISIGINHSLLKAQFFQATLTNEGNELVLSLIPTCGDISNVRITRLAFFIESTSPNPFTIGAIMMNTTNFPGVPTPLPEPPGANMVSSGTQTTLIASSQIGNNVMMGDPVYIQGTIYELARIPLSGAGFADFSLLAADDYSTYFDLAVDDGIDSDNEASYIICTPFAITSSPEVTCPASCTEDNYFTGDDVGGGSATGMYSEGVSGVPLPAELLTFTAKLDQQSALLKWESAQELNFKGYEVERSMDGKNFEPIAWVDGMTNTLEQQGYIYTDKTIARGETYYYRLRMVDLDLTFEHSPIVVLTTKGGKTEYVHISPNPAKDWINLELNLNDGSETQIELRDLSGKLIYTETRDLNEGLNGLQVDSSKFPAGIYILGVHTEQTSFTERLIIQ